MEEELDTSTSQATDQQVSMEVEVTTLRTPAVTFFNIKSSEFEKFKQEFFFEWPKGEINSVARKTKENCKVLKFSTDWTFGDVLKEISQLDPATFKNLFVFIINVKDVLGTTYSTSCDEANGMESQSEEVKNLKPETKSCEIDVKKEFQENSIHFCRSRQIIIQLTSESDNETKVFYNQETSMEVLHEVTNGSNGNEQAEEFSSFFHQLMTEANDESVIDDVRECDSSDGKQNDCGLKFESKIFDILKNHYPQLALRFITIFNSELSFRVASYCAANLSKRHLFAAFGGSFGDTKGDAFQAKMIWSVFKDQKYKSLLEASIDNEDREIFDYLVGYYCLFIIRLPVDHQIEISNKLIEKKKVDMLCDLLKSTDFLFPTDAANIEHARFQKIVEERTNFHKAIEDGNDAEIKSFIESNHENGQLEFVYNSDNKSALYTALNANKREVFLHLREKGFKGNDINALKKYLMCENIKSLSFGYERAVQLLADRSKISSKKNSQFQREKIKEWLTAISKTKYGGALMKAAAQCENLTIVFDVERDDVAGVDLDSVDSFGIMYPHHKLVIIGAKISEENSEQNIKGTIAHELAHYVIRMIFQNNEQPYFNESDLRYKKYKEVIEKCSNLVDEDEDDECEGIISSVFQNYDKVDWDAELIVRMFQIESHFDDRDEIVSHAKRKFEDLDKFTEDEVVSLMSNFNLTAMEYMNIFNKCAEFWSKTSCADLQFGLSEKLKNMLKKKLTVVTSNIPRLFLIEIYSHLKEIHGKFVDRRNVFVTQEKLKGCDFLEAFKLIMNIRMESNFILDFSSGDFQSLQVIDFPADKNFVIVVKDESQLTKLQQMLKDDGLKPVDVKIVYDWKKLHEKVKNQLLQRAVNFQGNQNISLLDIFGRDGDLSSIFNSDILNMLLSSEEIQINLNIGLDEDKLFKYLFHERSFMEKWYSYSCSPQELIYENKYKKFVIISDVAGSGKSWAMRNLALVCSKLTNWVTFVDLKQFTKYFMNIPNDNISKFIIDEVLKEKTNFEKEIFSWKYRKGEVKIFFDGFDEIAPVCTEIVLKIIKSFERNGKNQLFASTRSFFRIQLERELNVKRTYKLEELESKNAIQTVAMIWRLEDFPDLVDISREDIIKSDEYKKYIDLARKLIKKMPKSESTIALPQIYSIIAKITKEKKELDTDLNTYQLYRMMWDECYEQWYKNKGILRENVHKESQYKELNSALHLHELKAMQIFAPGKSGYCGIDPNDDWKEEELEGCGLMSKKDFGEFHFNHRTFHEFFVAEFIMRNLRSSKRAKEAFEYMLEVIFDENDVLIRKFLNEALQNEKKGEKLKWIELLAKKTYGKMLNFGKICKAFVDNLQEFDSLGSFFLDILKELNYEKCLTYFIEGIEKLIAGEEKNKWMKLLSIFGKSDDPLWKYQEIFVKLITSCIDIQTLLDIAKLINERKSSPTFFKEVLDCSNEEGENIIWKMVKRNFFNFEEYEKLVKILQAFMTSSEKFVDKVKAKNKDWETILHYFIRLEWDSSEINWTKLYESFWNFIVDIFRDYRAGLIKFILEPNVEKQSFIHIATDKFTDMKDSVHLEAISSQLQKTFNKSERLQLLTLKSDHNESLLYHFTVYFFKKGLQNVFWTFMGTFVDSHLELLEILTIERDFYGNNILLLICCRHQDVEKAMKESWNLSESEKKLLEQGKKRHFYESNRMGQNILQFSALFIDNVDYCENIWKFVKDNLNLKEIARLVDQRDFFGFNLLQICLMNKDKEVARFMAKEIIDQIRASGLYDEASVTKLKEAVDAKLLNKANADQEDILSLDWMSHKRSSVELPRLPPNAILKLLLFRDSYNKQNFAHRVLNQVSSEYVESMLKTVISQGNPEMLKVLLITTNDREQNFLQALIKGGISRQFYDKLMKFMQGTFDRDSYQEILDHKDKNGHDFCMTIARKPPK